MRAFSYGRDEFLFITNCLNYFGLSSLLLGSLTAYENFNNRKLKKYVFWPCAIVPLLIYFILNPNHFIISLFFSQFIPAIFIFINLTYNCYKKATAYKNRILFIFIFIIYYTCSVLFFETVRFFNINSICLLAISELLSTIAVMSIANLIFKYFKICKEKSIKIYDYIPFIWKHIPIATIISLIFLGGFFFSNYLETNSKNTVITNADTTTSSIAESVAITLENLNEISDSLSKSPFLKETLAFPSSDKIKPINKMLDGYKNSFNVNLLFALTNNNKIFSFSGYPYQNPSKIYKENPEFFKYLKKSSKEKNIKKRIFILDKEYYLATTIISRRFGKVGTIVIKANIFTIKNKFKTFNNIFIVTKEGKILISNPIKNSFKTLWSLSENSNNASLYPRELHDKELITINNEFIYVSRKFINSDMWSIVRFTPIGVINQAKTLGYIITSTLIIIALLLFWLLNQSQKIPALALQHQFILNSAKYAMILATDLNGKVTIYSQGTHDITGYSKQDFSNDYFKNIFFDKNKKPINFQKVISTNLKTNLEWICRKKNGEYINILMHIVPQFSHENKIIGYIFSGTDISKLKKTEGALAQQLQFLQILIDNIPTAIYYRNLNMKLLDCNKAFESLVGYSKKDLMKIASEEMLFDKQTNDISTKTDLEIVKNMKALSYELPVIIKNETKNLIFYKSAFKTIERHFNGIITVILDVTKERLIQKERDNLQNSLIQQNKLASLGELAGSIAHELNNPLSIILGFAQVLLRDKFLKEETKKGLQNIYDATLRSQNIIKNMLEFSRQDSSKIVKSKLVDIIEKTLPLLEKDLKNVNIEVVKDLKDTDILINIKPMQLQQVLLNIILNAKDAMPNGGKITISTVLKNGLYILSIADTGTGIAKENISKIFDPFFTTKEVGKGTGLGLSICYGIIQSMRGQIYVESELGKGTTFYVKFPV
ncbi:MAG: PAS domain S-box protein [Endomicrobium sp.]|jgi:PAS domain S-box-containing protein|uniref:ATP-binding protein n=1 Tax=Candidatus Endomicrobiellum cubanum TaxID=3242325 RepID=UPI002821BA0D|nr:PAS domain S-box protein [Endomicrobium sp.]